MRVAFVAIDTQWVDPSGSYASFSYAVRKLEASIRSAPDLAHIETTVIDLKSNDAEAYFEAIRDFRPTVVACSMYVWSVATFLELARLVKTWDPMVRVIAGGPAARASLLSLPPYQPFLGYLDAIATGEGEDVVRAIARDTDGSALASIPGLLLPHRLGLRATGPAERPTLDAYASPYQIGTAPRARTGFIETFRGCPISCAFCQWGEQRSDRVYGKGYLAAHLKGLVESRATNVFFTDAALNLSPRAFRNLMDADQEVNALSKFAVHGHLYPTHVKEEHLAFLDRVGKAQVSIGVQTFDPEVLRKLGRPFDLVRFDRVLRELKGRIAIDIELIYGLPGDTPEAFRKTFERTLELADTVRIFYPMVLPDALLERADEFGIRFDPVTFLIDECVGWSEHQLRLGWEELARATEGFDNRMVQPTWIGFMTPGGAVRNRAPRVQGSPALSAEEVASLTQSLGARFAGWSFAGARREEGRIFLDLSSPRGAVVLEVAALREGSRSFARHDGLAYSYRGSVDSATVADLGRVIETLHPSTSRLFAGGDR